MRIQTALSLLLLCFMLWNQDGNSYSIVRVPEDAPTFQAALDLVELPGNIVLGEGQNVHFTDGFTMPNGLSISANSPSSATLVVDNNLVIRNNNILSNIRISLGNPSGDIELNRSEQSYIINCEIWGNRNASNAIIFEDLNINSGIYDCMLTDVGFERNSNAIIQHYLIRNSKILYNGRNSSYSTVYSHIQGLQFESCQIIFFTSRRDFSIGADKSVEVPTTFTNCILINASNDPVSHYRTEGNELDGAIFRNCFISAETLYVSPTDPWDLIIDSSILRNTDLAIDIAGSSSNTKGTVQLTNNLFQDVFEIIDNNYDLGTVTETGSVINGSDITINVNDITYTFTPDSSLVGKGTNGRDIGPIQLEDLLGPKVRRLDINPIIINTDLKMNVSIEGEPTSY